MTPDQFAIAVADMQAAGAIPPGHGWKSALAAKLGLSMQQIRNFERAGTNQVQTDLAVAAIVAGLEPYSATPATDDGHQP